MRKLLPFAQLGFDTDNNSVFMNDIVREQNPRTFR
jgi:hypothetical protein